MDAIDCLQRFSELIPEDDPNSDELVEFIGKATAAKIVKDAIELSPEATRLYKQAAKVAEYTDDDTPIDDIITEIDSTIESKRRD